MILGTQTLAGLLRRLADDIETGQSRNGTLGWSKAEAFDRWQASGMWMNHSGGMQFLGPTPPDLTKREESND